MQQHQKVRIAAGGGLILLSVAAVLFISIPRHAAVADSLQSADLPTGKTITPAAAHGAIFEDLNPGLKGAPELRAGQAAAVAVAPAGRTLAILTSGFNVYFGADGKPVPEWSTEYVFLFDITGAQPKQIQVLPLRNSFDGLAWAPSSDRLFASGGSDDRVVEFVRKGSRFESGRTFPLGHKDCVGLDLNPGYWGDLKRKCGPMTAGLVVSPDGRQLLVANIQNDSVSLIDLASGHVIAEQDLRPGIIDRKHRGEAGGSYPRNVAWVSFDHAYVASERDREIISLAIAGNKIQVTRRMPVNGQPLALLANRSGSRLYAALDNTDQVLIFDTATERLVESIDAVAPQSVYSNIKKLGGANSNALSLTPDEKTLLVSNGGQNSVAVIRLSDAGRGDSTQRAAGRGDDDDRQLSPEHSMVVGLVPTGRYPTGVATSKDGAKWFIVNYKDYPGPNVRRCGTNAAASQPCLPDDWTGRPSEQTNPFDQKTEVRIDAQNRWSWRLEKAGFLTMPAPAPLELARLTKQVAHNNHFEKPETAAADEKLFSFLRAHVRHVIYIVKENKTYDEMFGDLEIGNGDPRLTFFPERFSPNHHALARNFVTLDNFLVSGAGSWTGWDWSVSAQTNDFRERTEPLAVASISSALRPEHGLEGEPGVDRNINMAYASSAERRAYDSVSPADPDVLPGARDIAAPDGPGGEEGGGYIWAAALRRGRTVRNFGFFGGFFLRQTDPPFVHDPHAQKTRVFFPTRPGLMSFSDPYYYSFDPAYPDYWRIQEWKREFAEFSAKKSAPNLMLIQLANDHTGHFTKAIDGVNTVDTQVADNDYALGMIMETVAHSPFANDTVIISIEDDPAGGLDHVDAFRSVALFAGAYVRQHALVSTRYTTVSIVKTIEALLGLEPIGLNDALASPMSAVFDPSVTAWTYKAIVPDVLRSTKLPLPSSPHACLETPRRSSEYWAKAMAGQDFSAPDQIEPASFTRALWRGLKGDAPYPVAITGADLRANRSEVAGVGSVGSCSH